MKKCFILSLNLLLLLIEGYAQPEGIHLSWNGSDKKSTSTTMALTWTENKPANGSVKYGMDSLSFKQKNASGFRSEAAGTYVFKVTLTKLKPDAIYYYQCGSVENGWSKTYRFHTGPEPGSPGKFVVGVWGDTQDNEFNTQYEKTSLVVEQLQKYPIQFTIHMGDIVNNGSKVPSWKGLFNTTEPVNAGAPFMPVTGNHDVNNDTASLSFQKPFPIFYDLFNLPAQQTDYAYDYGNTHFVAISSGEAKGAEPTKNWRYAVGSPEYKWLEADLAKARKNTKITWIILYMHHPLYSFGWSHIPGWQETITPLADKYKVDLCLSGHRHVYERHKAIRNSQPLPLQDNHMYVNPGGTVYVTNGTAGGSPQGIGGSEMPSMVFTSAEKMYNYAIMTIEGKSIHYEVYNLEGKQVDYFTIRK